MTNLQVAPLWLGLLLLGPVLTGCIGPEDPDPAVAGPSNTSHDEDPPTTGPEIRTISKTVWMIAGANTTQGSTYLSDPGVYWQYFQVLGDRNATVKATMTWDDDTKPRAEDLFVHIYDREEERYIARASGGSPIEMTLDLEPGTYGFFPRQDEEVSYFLSEEIHYEITGPIEAS